MPILSLDHVNLRTPHVEKTSAFFATVLSLSVQPSAGSEDMTRGAWICDASGKAVIHVTLDTIAHLWEEAGPGAVPTGSGCIHHIAFACYDYPGMVKSLREHDVRFFTNDLPLVGLRQLFLNEPNGILLELNFTEPIER